MSFSAAFAAQLPAEEASSFRERVAAWKALSPEQKAAESKRIAQAEAAQREVERDLRRMARRDRLRDLSGVEALFRAALLTDLEWAGNEPAHTAAMKALETRKLWLYGPVGAGKTHIACALVNDALVNDRQARIEGAVIISGLSILARIKSSYDDTGIVKPECVDVIGRLSKVPVLALDDLGKERFTPWAAEQFYLLLNARYEKNLPLIVTSNFTPRELEQHWSTVGMDAMYGPALVRRIVAMTGAPTQVFGRRAR